MVHLVFNSLDLVSDKQNKYSHYARAELTAFVLESDDDDGEF